MQSPNLRGQATLSLIRSMFPNPASQAVVRWPGLLDFLPQANATCIRRFNCRQNETHKFYNSFTYVYIILYIYTLYSIIWIWIWNECVPASSPPRSLQGTWNSPFPSAKLQQQLWATHTALRDSPSNLPFKPPHEVQEVWNPWTVAQRWSKIKSMANKSAQKD